MVLSSTRRTMKHTHVNGTIPEIEIGFDYKFINVSKMQNEMGRVPYTLGLRAKTSSIPFSKYYVNLVICLDVSVSMNTPVDGSNISRLNHLKNLVSFLDQVRDKEMVKYHIIQFGQTASTIYSECKHPNQPFTVDSLLYGNLNTNTVLESLIACQPETNYEMAIKQAMAEIKIMNECHSLKHPKDKCLNSILMITDGEATAGNINKTTDQYIWDVYKKEMKQTNVDIISCISVSEICPNVLQKISECGSKPWVGIVQKQEDVNAIISDFYVELCNLKYKSISVSVLSINPYADGNMGRFFHHLPLNLLEKKVGSSYYHITMKVPFPTSNEDFVTAFEIQHNINNWKWEGRFCPITKLVVSFEDMNHIKHEAIFENLSVETSFHSSKESIVDPQMASLAQWAKANVIFNRLKQMLYEDRKMVKSYLCLLDERIVKMAAFCQMHSEGKEILTPIIEKLIKWKEMIQKNELLNRFLDERAFQFHQTLTMNCTPLPIQQKAKENMQFAVNQLNEYKKNKGSEVDLSFFEHYRNGIVVHSYEPILEALGILFPCKVKYQFHSCIHEEEMMYYSLSLNTDVQKLKSVFYHINNPNLKIKGLPIYFSYTVKNHHLILFFKQSMKSVPLSQIPKQKLEEKGHHYLTQLTKLIAHLIWWKNMNVFNPTTSPHHSDFNDRRFLLGLLSPTSVFVDENDDLTFYYYPRAQQLGFVTRLTSAFESPECVSSYAEPCLVWSFGVMIYFIFVGIPKTCTIDVEKEKEKLDSFYSKCFENCCQNTPEKRWNLFQLITFWYTQK